MTVEDRVTDQEGKYRIYVKPIFFMDVSREDTLPRQQGAPGIAPRAKKSKMATQCFSDHLKT
jgi:hypothetical protein